MEKIELHLPSTLGYERVARSAVETIAEEMGFTEDRIEDLKTAVSEACMNAIEHGNQLDKTTSITVLLTAQQVENKLEITVSDEGKVKLPTELPPPGRMDDNGEIRGLGMFFISQLVDEMEISKLPAGGNQVKMIIYLTPQVNPNHGK